MAKRNAERDAWYHAKRRCENPNDASYSYYGGRGIVFCSQWADSFEQFLRDMGPKPTPFHSIDRIDNDGPYSPQNCRWATSYEQSRNKRNNTWLVFKGACRPIEDWARYLGVNRSTLSMRLLLGWDVESILTTPVRKKTVREAVAA